MLTLDADVDGFLAEVDRMDKAFIADIRDAVDTACKAGAQEAKTSHAFKSRTGDLEGKIAGYQVSSSQRGAQGVVESKSTHSGFVNNGTPPHMIYPKAAADMEGPLPQGQRRRRGGRARAALAFEKDGATVFAAAVHHPGTAADPFFDRGVAKTETVLVAEVEKALDKLVG